MNNHWVHVQLCFFLAGMTSVSQPLVFACVRRFDSELCNLASKDACALIRDALDNAVHILNSIKKSFEAENRVLNRARCRCMQ